MALDTEEEQVEKIQNIWRSYKRYNYKRGFVVLLGSIFCITTFMQSKT